MCGFDELLLFYGDVVNWCRHVEDYYKEGLSSPTDGAPVEVMLAVSRDASLHKRPSFLPCFLHFPSPSLEVPRSLGGISSCHFMVPPSCMLRTFLFPFSSSFYAWHGSQAFDAEKSEAKKAPTGADCSPKSQCLGIIHPTVRLYSLRWCSSCKTKQNKSKKN